MMTRGSESWTLNSSCRRRRIEAFEMTACRRLSRISRTDHRTNVSIIQKLKIRARDRLLITVQSQILKSFGHAIRRDGIEKHVIQGKVEGKRTKSKPDQNPHTNVNVRKHPEYTEDRAFQRNLSNRNSILYTYLKVTTFEIEQRSRRRRRRLIIQQKNKNFLIIFCHYKMFNIETKRKIEWP